MACKRLYTKDGSYNKIGVDLEDKLIGSLTDVLDPYYREYNAGDLQAITMEAATSVILGMRLLNIKTTK